jgi:hypothetical protein
MAGGGDFVVPGQGACASEQQGKRNRSRKLPFIPPGVVERVASARIAPAACPPCARYVKEVRTDLTGPHNRGSAIQRKELASGLGSLTERAYVPVGERGTCARCVADGQAQKLVNQRAMS